MKKDLTAPELVEAEWETIVAAEEALNASFLRTMLLRSAEGRVVSCGREDAVARSVMEFVPHTRPIDEVQKRLVAAAEELRRKSDAPAFVLSIGDGYILACGEAPQVAQILGAVGARGGVMPTLQVLEA